MKKFKDYCGEYSLCASNIDKIWAQVLSDHVVKIYLTKVEFFYFFIFFEPKLPWNWDMKSFMNVKLTIE
jgi:hypothetical protein